MGKKKKINPRRRPATLQDVEKAKRQATGDAVSIVWAIFFTVLRDKEGFGGKRLKRVWDNAGKLSTEIGEGRISVTDLIDVLKDEAGITLV